MAMTAFAANPSLVERQVQHAHTRRSRQVASAPELPSRGSRAGPLACAALAGAAASAAAGARRRKAGRMGVARRAASMQSLDSNALYLRVTCESMQPVGDRGAVLGVRQLEAEPGIYHFPNMPFEFPILLDAEQASLFRECRRHAEWKDFALCEVRIHASKSGAPLAELLVTEECNLPKGQGLAPAEPLKEGDTAVPVQVGEGFAVAMRLQAPLLVSSNYLLRSAREAIERLRVEQICEGDAGCDVELMSLGEDLAEADPSPERIGELVERMKPFAWYWSEHLRGGALAQASLGEIQERLAKLTSRPAEW